MVLAEDNVICTDKKLGYSAIYEASFSMKGNSDVTDLSEGVVLCAEFRSVTYIFQIAEVTNIFSESSVRIMDGTLFVTFDPNPWDGIEVDHFPLTTCRFPTKDELEWYNTIETV